MGIKFWLGLLSLITTTIAFSFSTAISSSPNPRRKKVSLSLASFASDFGPPEPSLVAVFSDVDGTLVHCPKKGEEDELFLLQHQQDSITIGSASSSYKNHVLQLPPSATRLQGVISSNALAKCQELRTSGVKLVLVSGMRTSTLLKRLPFLPASDAYCNEGGGRIFFRVPLDEAQKEHWPAFVVHPEWYDGATPIDLQPFTLQEDLEWRAKMEDMDAAGTDGYRGVELPGSAKAETAPLLLSDRQGALWKYAQQLTTAKDLVLDTNGYSACIRINMKQQTSDQGKVNLEEMLRQGNTACPPGMSSSTNLGCVDFYPAASGKKNWYVQ